jgi:tetratricopeptide (TPR) repeat protein
MKKMLAVQIGIAVIAFAITGWIFFKERPQVEVNHQLQQQLNQVQQENKKLVETAKPVQHDIKQSRAYLREGRTLFHEQQYDQAISLYDKALESFPDDPYGWSLKGYALFKAGKIPESIEANQKAVQLDPGDPLNYIDLAKSYCAAKQYDDAKRVLLSDPPPDLLSAVSHYSETDGEIRRVCKPILSQMLKPAGTGVSTKADN